MTTTQNKTQHTATPFFVTGGNATVPKVHIMAKESGQGFCVAHVYGDNKEQALANAAYIVQCVNAHQELVEALRDMVDLTVNRQTGQWTEGEIALACKQAESILAKVGGAP